MTAFGKKAAAPGSLTPADQTLLDSANAATLTANSNAGLDFLTCSGKNGNAQWTTSAGVTVTKKPIKYKSCVWKSCTTR